MCRMVICASCSGSAASGSSAVLHRLLHKAVAAMSTDSEGRRSTWRQPLMLNCAEGAALVLLQKAAVHGCLRCSPLSGSTALMSLPDSPVHSLLLFLLLVRSRAELECASLGIDIDKPRLIGDLLASISLPIEGDSRSSGDEVGCLQPCTQTPCRCLLGHMSHKTRKR